MVIGDVTLELHHRAGDTAKLKMTVRNHAVEASVRLPELETIALYLADQVGRWRDEMVGAEKTTRSNQIGGV
jgi:hypothetical protein